MLSIIVAKANNDVIGGDNKLLWHISKDLKRFKEITTGHTIIMGRKTFESLPKVLPNRKHIVITRDRNFKVDSDMVHIVNDISTVLEKFKDSDEEAFVIGGGEIYKSLLPYCKKIYLTRVYKNFEGDTIFPNLDLEDWNIINKSEIFTNEKDNLKFDFIDLIRK
ncbi:dihydrofolate reductase [Clostridium isatidis]|uniref:Dihydrofolate reductase n=1 Tax=Clostridium isatidis TaxID=182773 RepID=A0A343JFN0_9CLOT|nr:dihydrofolate reductase [Clostridium isatidis]ASW44338.1 diacylglycerol kinase [Clostridium isatidis]NLZ34164.1 dihydrofolate reductase [Clostridiales bacterium]